MTIDNIDISKLKPYNKSQYQSFELLWYLICREEFKPGHFTPINDSGGGDGVEFYLTLDNGDVWGWQCKFFDRLSEKGRKNQIKASLKKACEVHGKSLKKWYLCTTSDFTPKENEWFNNTLKKVISDDCPCLNLFHYGDSDLCSFLYKHPSIAKFFFGTNLLDEGWINSRYSKLMNREEIKEKYILDLHSETDAQGEIYFYIGGPLLGSELTKRLIDNETIKNCIEEYNASIKSLDDFICEEEYVSIKNEAIKIISEGRTILTDMISLYKNIIEELHNSSVCSKVNELIDGIRGYYTKLQKLYEDLSLFKNSDILSPVNWEEEEKEVNSQIKHCIKTVRETVLGPYFVLRNYWSPLYYVFGNFERIKEREVHIRGNASKGKSHLALNILNQYHNLNLPAIYISAKDLKTQEDIKSQILKNLDLPSTMSFQNLLSSLNMLGKMRGVKTLFIIDGLNESLHWNMIWKSGISEIRAEINAGLYDNLILITTYRTSYEKEIFGDFFYQRGNHWLNIEVSGFDNNFEDALERYKSYYMVNITNATHIVSLFKNNPLALRIFCITNRGTSVSLSHMTIFDVFDKYVEYCNKNIVESLNLPIRYNKSFLIKKLFPLCEYAWKNNTNRIPLDKANMSISELSVIENEDLLIYREWNGQEDVMFTYDLLAGYLIGKYILQKYSDAKSFIEDFDKTILPKLITEDGYCPHLLFDDITTCLLTLAIEKFGFIFEDYQSKNLLPYIIKAIYQSSVITLKDNEITIKNYLKQHLTLSADYISFSFPVAFSTENPLNFVFTSSLLKDMSVWERDLLWTTKIMEYYRYEHLESELTDLITDFSGSKSSLHENVFPLMHFIMWLLTTNCHHLRFLATKTLFYVGRQAAQSFMQVLNESFYINDLYVPERVLAVAYGLVLSNLSPRKRDATKELIIEIANIVWDNLFSSNRILNTPHINIRHYSQRLMEIVSKIFPDDFNRDIKAIYVPYGITKNDIDNWEKVKDFGGPMRMDFSNYTLGTIIPGGHSYSNPELKQQVRGYIMKRVAELGWSERHFENIDNNINSFSDYSRHNDYDKIDRFGKKYSWIAYYEAAGILQDNALIDDRYDKWLPAGLDIDPTFPKANKKEDNIFPNILRKDLSMDEWLDAELDFPIDKKLYVSCTSANHTNEFVCLYGYMTMEDKELDRSRFVFIRPFMVKNECFESFRKYLDNMDISTYWIPDVHDNYSCGAAEMALWDIATYSNWGEMTFRTSIDDQIKAYKDMESILELYLKSDGDAELDPMCELDNLIDKANSDFVEFKVLTPTMNYCPSFDCSIGSHMTLAKEIIKSEDLYFIPQTFDLEDSNESLAFYNASFILDKDNSQHYCYLRRDILDNFLKRNDLRMIWLVWGEKDHAGRPVLFDKYKHKQLVDYHSLEK